MGGILLLNAFAALAVLIALPVYRLLRSIWEDHRIERGVREARRAHERAAREILALKERGEKIPWELRDEELRLSVEWIGAVMESYGRAPGWSEEPRAKYPITTVHVGLEDLARSEAAAILASRPSFGAAFLMADSLRSASW